MDKENNEDDHQFQSETGRESRIQTCFLVSSAASPLFYTVSGNQTQVKVVDGKRYYLEQLGCPSIIKPSFRDLPGCTRLSSVSVPSPTYRQFPLDKLNKTIMGKSPPTSTNATSSFKKRFSVNRGESRYMSPIKVNTKIRHIYSHITRTSDEPSATLSTMSRTTSQQSSIHSASTHTQTEEDDLLHQYENQARLIQSVDEETAMDKDDLDLQRDAFTSMTPPPTPTPLQLISADTPLARSLPPGYAGKLEDLEKITGHIVIQRFFTRADEAFGFWLEKQLGMNVKSVGVGSEEDVVEPGPTPSPSLSPSPLHPNLESFTGIENPSAKRMRESRILEKIIEVDDILGVEEIIPNPGEISTSSTLPVGQGVKDKECSMRDNVKCECFWECNGLREKNLTISANKIEGLSKMEQDIIDQCIAVEIIRGKQNNEELQTDSRLEQQISEMPTTDYDRPCIPDVIDVSQFFNKTQTQRQSHSEDAKTETTNEDSEELQTVVSNQSSTIPTDDVQYKVVEYLGKLEISSPVNDASTSANSLNSELDWVGGESCKYEGASGPLDEDEIKRSISVDSCIGTESSGERNMFNDSGILMDSSRMDMDIPEEDGEISSFAETAKEMGQEKLADYVQCELPNVAKLSADDKSIQEITALHNRPALSNNQSMDDSTNYSRSDVSSGAMNKQISDEGGDADQSESDSELCSLQEKTLDEDHPRLDAEGQRFAEEEVEDTSGLLVDEDDDENGSQADELDQFDTIIENHEKEKRLRPIYRKRNVSTQTSKTVESSASTVSCTTGSRCTTASSDSSSFDLEFISKSKKYISHHVPSSKHLHDGDELGVRKRSYLPTGGSGLNVLNMKFSMGREFESEVSIRIPAKSPTASSVVSSSSSFNYQNLPNAIVPPSDKQSTSKGNKKSQTQSQFPAIRGTLPKEHFRREGGQGSSSSVKLLPLQQDPELKTLWKDVKSKMEDRVETSLQVTGSKINLVTTAGEPSAGHSATMTHSRLIISGDKEGRGTKLPLLISSNEQDKLKRSLIRLKRILDD